jgi:hypothetical protein
MRIYPKVLSVYICDLATIQNPVATSGYAILGSNYVTNHL